MGLSIFSLSPPKVACRTEICRGISHVAKNIRVADGGKNSTFGPGSLGYKNIGPLFPIEVNERASCAVLVAGCFTRGIDVLNRALEKYRLGQSEPIFCGR